MYTCPLYDFDSPLCPSPSASSSLDSSWAPFLVSIALIDSSTVFVADSQSQKIRQATLSRAATLDRVFEVQISCRSTGYEASEKRRCVVWAKVAPPISDTCEVNVSPLRGLRTCTLTYESAPTFPTVSTHSCLEFLTADFEYIVNTVDQDN
jgi:hypothetical protein